MGINSLQYASLLGEDILHRSTRLCDFKMLSRYLVMHQQFSYRCNQSITKPLKFVSWHVVKIRIEQSRNKIFHTTSNVTIGDFRACRKKQTVSTRFTTNLPKPICLSIGPKGKLCCNIVNNCSSFKCLSGDSSKQAISSCLDMLCLLSDRGRNRLSRHRRGSRAQGCRRNIARGAARPPAATPSLPSPNFCSPFSPQTLWM